MDHLQEPILTAGFRDVINDLLPHLRQLASGEYAISVGGSIGKGISDERSDIDLRLFCREQTAKAEFDTAMSVLSDRMAYWRTFGVQIDGCWVRRIEDVQEQLQKCVSGTAQPYPYVWTLWGYHFPTDIFNQFAIEDPHGILARWKAILTPYPPELKKAIVNRHGQSLRYWVSDYHYGNKVHRGDIVFLASITARLVHDMIQILYAVNEIYYPGDGKNLELLPNSSLVPDDFKTRVREALYPRVGADIFERQQNTILNLAAEVLAIADTVIPKKVPDTFFGPNGDGGHFLEM